MSAAGSHRAYPTSVSVVIVGGGVTGCSIAWQLARRGVDVALFEMEHLAWGASGRNAGMNGVETHYASGLGPYRLRSQEIMREVERELGEFEFVQNGGLEVFIGAPGEHPLPAPTDQRAGGSRTLSGDEARAFLPLLSERVLAARFSPKNGHLWPFKLVHRFADGALEHGARVYTGAKVERIVLAGRDVQGVIVDGQLVRAQWVVNATNAWSGPLAETAGLRLRVTPERGQIVVTEPLPPLLPVTMGHFVHNSSNYWRQTPDGKLIIGGSRMLDAQGRGNLHDRRVTPHVLHSTLNMVVQILPVLARARIVRAWGGTMGFTPDGKPYIGDTEHRRGLLLACGFNGAGLGWAPVAGELLAQHVTGQSLTLPLDAVHPDRDTGLLEEA